MQAAETSTRGSRDQPDERADAARGRIDLRQSAERVALLFAWLVLIAIFGALAPDTFLTTGTLSAILGTQAVLVVLTLGLIIPLRAGDYDLSVASVMTLAAMLIGVLNVNEGWPLWAAALGAFAAAGFVGLLNGFVVIVFEIDPFIVTLGSGTVLSGIVLWLSNSNTISGISPGLVDNVIGKQLLGIPLVFYYGLVLCVLIWYLFEWTPLGRRILFVGRNRSVSRLSGIHVSRIRWGALVASALIAGLAGLLYVGVTGSADPSSGNSYLLPAFAAAFLGGTSITPGRFNPWGSLFAVYFLVTGITGLQLLGVSNFIQPIFYGGALILAVVLSQLVQRATARRSGARQ